MDWYSKESFRVPDMSIDDKLRFGAAGLAIDYDYMDDFRTKDVAKAIATEMEADAGTFMGIKAIGAGIGVFAAGVLTGGTGTAAGAGIGTLLATAGLDLYQWTKHINKKPGEFWQDYASNFVEASNEAGLGDFVEEFNKATQLSGGAKTETPKSGFSTAGALAGVILRDVAGQMIGGIPGIIGANMVFDGFERMHNEIGAGKNVNIALKNGIATGLATGISSSVFLGALPRINNKIASTYFSGIL